MKEQDFFEIMDGLPARQIAEAAEWKYKQGSQSENEIDMMLSSSAKPEKITYWQTEPESKTISAEQDVQADAVCRPQQTRVIRSAAAGLAAVAAVFTLIFGGIALKLHYDNIGADYYAPGMSASEGDTSDSQFSGTDESSFAEGDNFFGGHGPLRPVTSCESFTILQDDDYYYLNGYICGSVYRAYPCSRLSKLLIGADPAAFQFEECLQTCYDLDRIICSGQDFYYCDWTTNSIWEGYAGGLKRLLSDGTTDDLHPQNEITDIDSVSGYIQFTDILQLGDTGIYYLRGYSENYSEGICTEYSPDPVLLNSRTGETLPMMLDSIRSNSNSFAARYDNASGHLFLINGARWEFNKIIEVDINTGKTVQTYKLFEEIGNPADWFVSDHVLHYLDADTTNSSNIKWYAYDLETGEITVLLEDCRLTTFAYYDGRVYALRHATLGNDALLSYTPDGTDETLLGECSNALWQILPISDPDNILLRSDGGSCFLYRKDAGISRLSYGY